MSADKTVLITGGTGFIGSHVARALLDHGRNVCLLDINKDLTPESRFILGKFADKVPIEHASIDSWPRMVEIVKKWRPSEIVHMGGVIDPLILFKNPELAYRVNVGGTINVLECVKQFEVRRMINFSSIGVLPPIKYQPIDSSHPVITEKDGPASGAYGAAKVSCEAFCYAYNQAFGLDFRTIRPSAAYGFGMQWHSANYMKQFVEPAVRGEKMRIPSGGPMPRDYTHVHDIASLVVAAIDGPNDADRVFYAATGQPLTTATNCAKLVMELVPGSDIQIADVLSEDDMVEFRFRGIISIENARTQLGWKPKFSLLREGISEYIGTYRAFLAGSK